MPETIRKAPARALCAARAGFTLIELLAVLMIISILMVFLVPRVPEVIDQARVTACRKNMQEIYNGLMMFQTKFERLPRGSGVAFFAELVASDTWEASKGSAEKLTCPGPGESVLAIYDVKPDQRYKDLSIVDGGWSTYAGRDMRNHPLRRFPGDAKEALVADDNDPEMNHRNTTVVLYADGSVGRIEIYDLQTEGILAPEEKHLYVGPESPVEALRKLSLD